MTPDDLLGEAEPLAGRRPQTLSAVRISLLNPTGRKVTDPVHILGESREPSGTCSNPRSAAVSENYETARDEHDDRGDA